MNGKEIGATALVIGLSLFLFACEKEVAERGSGRKVDIIFSVNNSGYGANHPIQRSSEIKNTEAETVYIPLDDNYYMSATLVAEPAEETTLDDSQLRVAEPFEVDQKICFVVYPVASDTPLDVAIYTWNGTKFVPDVDPLGVVPDGTDYHFVAYSYFGDPTETPADTDIEPFQDLVWGEATKPIVDNETSRTVTINMTHKFSRVRVKVDASTITNAKITDIEDVVIDGGEKADLTVKTGVVAPTGVAVTETVVGWTSVDAGKARQSGYKVFYPSLTKITIGSLDVEVDGTPLPQLTDLSVVFSQALVENTSYTVLVDVRESMWARSNVYWVSTGGNTGYLTFDTADEGHQGYQGVFFKWGSLVGLSPAQTNGSDAFSGATAVYIPTYNSSDPEASTWVRSTSHSYQGGTYWNVTTVGVAENDPGHIPYIDGTYGATGATFLSDPAQNTPAMYAGKRGDICRYLSSGSTGTHVVRGSYRSPKFADFGTTTDWTTGAAWQEETANLKDDGTSIMADRLATPNGGAYGEKMNAKGGLILPGSGRRNTGGGRSLTAGGYYWAASIAVYGKNAYNVIIGSSSITLGYTYNENSYAQPVRCIKD
jgi:hypothetical protein